MRHLRIRNFGPIKDADLDLGKINVIIGRQSSGKSCVLKTACYCSWVEKRIEITQTADTFSGAAFILMLGDYHKMTGYVRNDTYIEYESDYLRFRYDNRTETFSMEWKSGRWDYRRPKVSYVPADRNLVAAIPGWSALPLDDNLLDFMAEWDRARRYVGEEKDILGLGMSYVYDKRSNSDKLRLKNNQPLILKESSSGMQSLIPMFVHLDYIAGGQYSDESVKLSYEQKEERSNLLEILRNELAEDEYREVFERFSKTDHSEIFLEEPENNLFPPTQCQFVDWLLDAVTQHDDLLFVATHSPYILNQFIKDDPKDLTLFFTYCIDPEEQLYSVRRLKEEEIHEIYYNGVDMFFNFETYV